MTNRAALDSATHYMNQDGQPYGSERRCCLHCGIMIWPGMQKVVPVFVESFTEWAATANNCARVMAGPAS